MLVQPGHLRVAAQTSAGRCQLAGDHAQQGRLAAAIVARHGQAARPAEQQVDRVRLAMRQDHVAQFQQQFAIRHQALGRQQQPFDLGRAAGAGVHHPLLARLLRLLRAQAQLALAILAFLLFRVEQQLALIAFAALALTARHPFMLPFCLLLRLALFASGAGLFRLQGGNVAGLLQFPLLRIHRVIAAVAAQALRRQLDDGIDVRQQAAVMADQQQAASPARHLRHQAGALSCIEMVARLIEHQPVRLRQPGALQGDALAFATAEATRRRVGIDVAQIERIERLAQAGVGIPALAHQGVVGLVDAAGGDARQRGQHLLHAGERRHVGIALRIELLRHVMHAAVAAHGARRRLRLARQQARQNALAHAVIADEADTLRGKGKLQIGKQGAAIGQHEGKTVEL